MPGKVANVTTRRPRRGGRGGVPAAPCPRRGHRGV